MNIMGLFNGARYTRRGYAWGIFALVSILACNTRSAAQPSPRSLLIGGGIGAGIYHGEFNSLQADFSLNPGFTAGLLLQYNLNEAIAVGAALGYSSLPYSITDFAKGKYASNFFGPAGSTTYPGSTVALTDDNSISISQLQLFGKLYLPHLLWDKYTPYGMAGIGLINFTPQNDDGETLPTNITGPYSTTSLIIPLGGGLEYKITDKLTAWGEITYHRTFTDYLDGYAHYIDYEFNSIPSGPGTQETQSDHFTTLRIGISYKVYEHQPDPEPEPSSSPLASGEDPAPSESSQPPVQPEPPRPEQREPTPREPETGDVPTQPQPEAKPTGDRTNDAFRRDPNAADSDNDNLSDQDEINTYGTNPYSIDSDNDGLTDGEEVALYNTDPLAADTDGDLLSDLSEIRRLGTNARRVDTDGDLLTDNEELARTGTDPLNPDTDGDGVFDGADDCPTLPGLPENNGCPEQWLQKNDITSETDPRTPLDPLEPGERREFSEIYFRQNSDDFDFSRPETGQELTELLNFMQECDEVGVLIEGHTSSEGSAVRNMELSRMRADRVREWLLANGVAPQKLLGTVGYGSRMPKIPEPTRGNLSETSLERIRAQNRRITAVIRKACE